MQQDDDLEEIASQAAQRVVANPQLKEELSQVQMIAMAELYEGWAQGRAATAWDSAKLVGWAAGLRRLADMVGPDWQPSPPDEISLIGQIARALVVARISRRGYFLDCRQRSFTSRVEEIDGD